ncbi:MAG: TRAP transporter small permease subunit [Treponema sp.]|nr:TRAP transporter small permease subunit [Treponema sp.]
MKKNLLFIRDIVRDIIEKYVPVFSFAVMFVTFIMQVFFRYIVRRPLTWSMEVIAIGFVWTVVFGACYTMRLKSHVKFTMIYDRLPPVPAAVIRTAGNSIIAAAFASLVVASYKYSFFIGFQKTSVFRISYTFIFLPFVYFLCSVIGYTLSEIVEDINVISGKTADSTDHKAAEAAQ